MQRLWVSVTAITSSEEEWRQSRGLTPLAYAVQSHSESTESHQRFRIPDTRDCMNMRIDEVTNVDIVLKIQFDQQVERAGRRVNFGRELEFGNLIGNVVGLAKLAFDSDEVGAHK